MYTTHGKRTRNTLSFPENRQTFKASGRERNVDAKPFGQSGSAPVDGAER